MSILAGKIEATLFLWGWWFGRAQRPRVSGLHHPYAFGHGIHIGCFEVLYYRHRPWFDRRFWLIGRGMVA